MSTDRFTKEQFEAALPTHNITGERLWEPLGLVQGEQQYAIPVEGTNKRIVIRSSIGRDRVAADTGQDSIRLWAEYWYPKADKWCPLKKLDAWTTRVTGWEGRMVGKLRELYKLALEDSKGHKQKESNDGKASSTNRSIQADAQPAGEVAPTDHAKDSELLCTVQPTPAPKPQDRETNSGAGAGAVVQEVPGGDGSDGSEDPLSFLGDEPPSLPEDLNDSIEDAVDFLAATACPPILSDAEAANEVEMTKSAAAQAKAPNAEQIAAIEAPIDGAIRVLAGPGSGKTFVLARRYAYLLENGTKPEDILAVTFNKTMATELLARIKRVNPQVEGTAAETQVCTIHAACYRMLKAEGDRRQVVKHWVLKKHIQKLAEGLWPYTDERPGWEEIAAWINTAKAYGKTTTDDLDFFVEAMGHHHGSNLHKLRRDLDNILSQRENALTFADMLLDVETKLGRDKGFREKWQAQYKVVIVDEGQDTSRQAMKILTTLAAPQDRFAIVGDTDQLLFRFAGATPEANLFDGFEERFPEGILLKLTRNYRSTTTIINAYNRLIKYNYALPMTDVMEAVETGTPTPLYNGPYDWKYLKDIEPRPDAPEGDPITWNMYQGPGEEATALTANILHQLDSGHEPGSIFVGARTRAQLGYLEGPLTRAKVPFINITGGSFWTMKHVADVVAYMKLAYNEDDGKAFKRVFNVGSNWSTYPWGATKGEYCTHRFLGRAFLQACTDYKTGEPSYRYIWAAAGKKNSFRPGVTDLSHLIHNLQATMAHSEHAGELAEAVISECYNKWLRHEEGITTSDEAENGKLEDLLTVVAVASQFSIADFVEYVDDCVKAAEAVKDKSWDDYVVISTVHRLKGLERTTVYGVGLCENGEKGLLPHTFSMSDPPQLGILPGSGMGRVEDERCVAYVLVSRAKKFVHLSGVLKYRGQEMWASRFVEEMGLKERAQEDKSPRHKRGEIRASLARRFNVNPIAGGLLNTERKERS